MKNDKFLVTKKLLRKSSNDLKSAKDLFSFEDYAVDIIFFHCQQAVEKILKAFLDFKGVRFKKTHDIEKLLDHITNIDSSFQQIKHVANLTPYAVEFRYDELIEASRDEVEETIKKTEETIKFVRDKIQMD